VGLAAPRRRGLMDGLDEHVVAPARLKLMTTLSARSRPGAARLSARTSPLIAGVE